ncbi:enoyl-CoA hydratase/isomerase family protein [Paenibacillus hamazuiensis]|uniref:enoyl-CoA hydratase/isomerase family protein n=1 Tax=Paenibacillus hamazuiensis TaxID=2936508 RepID=UPI00200D080E|nr:enoyl-CoA hydratase/isomerase family protein [Paenibacillus hamazuiensis]
MSQKVVYDKRKDGVASVILNRPDSLNALDAEAKLRLGEIWAEAAADPEVRVIVLSGAGNRAFCAGSDLKEMSATGKTVSTDHLQRSLPGLVTPLDKPVIAALHGYCIGMGLTLAIHCDIRIAAENTILGFPEVKHGMISGISAIRLPLLIPSGIAAELMLAGHTIPASEALRIGLINRIAAGDVLEEANGLAAQIAALPVPGVRETTRLIRAAVNGAVLAQTAEIDAARSRIEASAGFADRARMFKQQTNHQKEHDNHEKNNVR